MEPRLYDVTLVGFPEGTVSGEPPANAMCRIFGIDEATARRFVASTPITVKHDATADIAKSYMDPLQAIGAKVVIRPSASSSSPPPPPPSSSPREKVRVFHNQAEPLYDSGFEAEPTRVSPPPVPFDRPTPSPKPDAYLLDGVGVMPSPSTPLPHRKSSSPPRQPERTPLSYTPPPNEDEKEQGFLASIPGSFILPFRGTGKWWLVAATIITLGSSVLGAFGSFLPIVGMVLQLFLAAGLLTICAKFFQSCLASGAYGQKSPGPLPELMHFLPDFVVPGFALTLWFVTAFLPLIGWINHLSANTPPAELMLHPLTIALALTPYLLWPIALAHAASSGSFLSLWNIPGILLSLVRAPFRYAIVLLGGLAAALLPMFVAGIIIHVGGPIGAIVGLFVAAGSLAYSHAVMGTLMGHLARTKPAVLPD